MHWALLEITRKGRCGSDGQVTKDNSGSFPQFITLDLLRQTNTHYLSGGASLEPSSVEKGVGDTRGVFAWFLTPKPQTLKPDILGYSGGRGEE
ncbi:hypothetical protein CapIbe_009591 [Capra ibex]